MMEKELTKKKPWNRPELIVLVRSNPEEMVLLACKSVLASSTKCTTGGGGCSGTAAIVAPS